VFGVELIPSAVEDAKSNAKRNGISNCLFVEGRVEDHLTGWIMQITEGADNVDAENKNIVAIVNLPRAGQSALRTGSRIKNSQGLLTSTSNGHLKVWPKSYSLSVVRA